MAIVRVVFSRHHDDAGNEDGQAWYEWDDASNRRWVTAVGIVNNTPNTVYAEAYRVSDGARKVSSNFLPNTDTSFVVSTGAAARLQGTVNHHGVLDGVQFVVNW